jgi:hypothetical protein
MLIEREELVEKAEVLKIIEDALNSYVLKRSMDKYLEGAIDTRVSLDVGEVMKVLKEHF